jgi:hypothetical protein
MSPATESKPRCCVTGCTRPVEVELELVDGVHKPKKATKLYHHRDRIYACAVHAADPELRRQLGRNWQGLLFL